MSNQELRRTGNNNNLVTPLDDSPKSKDLKNPSSSKSRHGSRDENLSDNDKKSTNSNVDNSSINNKHEVKSDNRLQRQDETKPPSSSTSSKQAPTSEKNIKKDHKEESSTKNLSQPSNTSKPSQRSSTHFEGSLQQENLISTTPEQSSKFPLFRGIFKSKQRHKSDKRSDMSKSTPKDTTNHIITSTSHNKNVSKQQPSTANASEAKKDQKEDKKPKEHKKDKKDKKQQRQPQTQQQQQQQQQRQRIVANSLSDLSEDLQDKIRKAKIPEDKINANFRILLNILHFLTKDSFRMHDNSQTPPMVHYRRPYASAKLIEEAKRIVRSPDQNTKKLFKNIEFSGKGGFGRVFGAKDRTTKKHVAIKKLPHVTEKDKRSNWCEIGFLATCKHPNIVRFLDAWEVKDEVWIVMEFLEGGTLHEAIKVHQFCERHIAYIAREVLKALDFLHNNKFVHRDLKSANVMMSVDGEIKLIDFGLCADVSEGERTQMVGSPFWMPPEMIRREPHGCPADIWSFAVCLLEMYLREPPNASSRLRSMFITATEGLKNFIPARASPEARDFLSRCLELDPKKRATAAELLKHPFVQGPRLSDGIKDVLRGIFVSQSLALSGI